MNSTVSSSIQPPLQCSGFTAQWEYCSYTCTGTQWQYPYIVLAYSYAKLVITIILIDYALPIPLIYTMTYIFLSWLRILTLSELLKSGIVRKRFQSCNRQANFNQSVLLQDRGTTINFYTTETRERLAFNQRVHGVK